jgi:hypothetical protein
MTISTTTSRISYNGNAVTTVFSFPYRFLANGDLKVVSVSAGGVETTKTLTTDYTLTGAGDDAGGSVTMLVAPASGTRLIIYRDTGITQETDYISGDPFPAETHERALDRLTMIAQEIGSDADRSIKVPVGDSSSLNTTLPAAANRLDKFIVFDATTGETELSTVTQTQVASAVAAAYAAGSTADAVTFLQAGTGAVARTAQAKLRESVSILDFGASTAGTAAANAAAITAAIAAASSIYIPAGTYACNNVTMLTGRTVHGDGPSSVLSFPAGQTGIYGLSTSGATYLENITLRSFRLLGAVGASGFSEQIHLCNLNGARNLIVDAVQFVGFQGDGLYLGAHTTNDRHNVNVKITNCLFDGVNKDNRNGLSVIDVDGLMVRGCTFQNCTRSNMPGPIDLEPNHVANVIRKVNIVGNHFENTDTIQGAVNIILVQDADVDPECFNVSNNTFDVTSYLLSFRSSYAYTSRTNLVLNGNSGSVAAICEMYNYFDGVSIIGNSLTVTASGVIGFTNTDTIDNLIMTGNVFTGSGTPDRAFSLRCGAGHVISGNMFCDFVTYGFLTGIAGGTLSDTAILGNTFVNCGTYAVGAVAGSVSGVSCTYLGNTYSSKHQFPAWRNDDTGDITNGDSSPTTFNADTLPDSFTREGIFRACINGDTAVPNDGGYQGLLETHCEAGEIGRKFKYQIFYPANNGVSVESFYTRKAESGSNAWSAWKDHAGV